MGLLNNRTRSTFDYTWNLSCRDDLFKISDINSKLLKKQGIHMSVADFKNEVRKSKPFARVQTGSASYAFRNTSLYKFSDLKKKIKN